MIVVKKMTLLEHPYRCFLRVQKIRLLETRVGHSRFFLSLSKSFGLSCELRLLRTPPLSLVILSSTESKTRSLVAIRPEQQRRKRLTCNALFGLGVPELAVIAGVAALLFGPKKLPEIGKSIGKTVKSFQQAAKGFESELKTEPEDSVGGSSPPVA
ncbi:hypothetical protein Bca101_020662 [Brassica carinata]